MGSRHEILAGLSISLTGRFALQGQQALDGIRLWELYVNSHGGIAVGVHGRRPVRLVYYDDQSQVNRAEDNAVRLLQEDRVDVLFGPYGSGSTMAVARVSAEHQKLLWNHGGSSDEIFTRGHRYLVSTPSPASDYLREYPRWLARKAPDLRRICVAHSSRGTFAAQVARGVGEAASAVRVDRVDLVSWNDRPETAESLFRGLTSIGPEVLVLAGSFEGEVRIVQMRDLWPETISEVAAVAAGVQAFSRELDERAEGVVGPSQWEPGLPCEEMQGPDSDWFVRRFQERFGHPPEYTAAGSFAIGLVLVECARLAGSLEDDRLREVAVGLDFNTFYGRFLIDPATGRQIGHAMLLTQWQQGRKVVLPRL